MQCLHSKYGETKILWKKNKCYGKVTYSQWKQPEVEKLEAIFILPALGDATMSRCAGLKWAQNLMSPLLLSLQLLDLAILFFKIIQCYDSPKSKIEQLFSNPFSFRL